MSFSGFGESPKWGLTSPDAVKDVFRKEQVLKDIIAGQEDLRGLFRQAENSQADKILSSVCAVLLARVKGVEADVDKLTSGNTTLQMYIDNLTVQMAKGR